MGGLLKYLCAAPKMQYLPWRKYAMLSYRRRISCLEYFLSSQIAYRISVILRPALSAVAFTLSCGERLGSSLSTLRTYCMVRVDAPCCAAPPLLLDTKARTTERRSTPPCF